MGRFLAWRGDFVTDGGRPFVATLERPGRSPQRDNELYRGPTVEWRDVERARVIMLYVGSSSSSIGESQIHPWCNLNPFLVLVGIMRSTSYA